MIKFDPCPPTYERDVIKTLLAIVAFALAVFVGNAVVEFRNRVQKDADVCDKRGGVYLRKEYKCVGKAP